MPTTPKIENKVSTRSGMRNESNIKPPQKPKVKAKVDGVEDGKTSPSVTSTDEIIQSSKLGYVLGADRKSGPVRSDPGSGCFLSDPVRSGFKGDFSRITGSVIKIWKSRYLNENLDHL